jgi:dienelactone hydrolase
MTVWDYFFRVLARFGAVPLWLLLVFAGLVAFYILSKQGTRANVSGALSLGIPMMLIAGVLVVTPAALRGGIELAQLLRTVVSEPPKPSGPYAVTVATLELARDAHASRGQSEPILLHLWYPTDAPAAPDQHPIACAQLGDRLRLPHREQAFPVVLFAPGLFGRAEQNTLVIGSLASHGYVVAAIDDVGLDSPVSTASPEGEEARLRPIDFSSAEAVEATMRRGGLRVAQEAAKALEALDRLEACFRNDINTQNKMDFARIGFVGFSFGGTVAAESSLMDARVAAVVNLDGSFFGRAAEQPLDVPFMVLSSDFDPQMVFDTSSARRHEFKLYQRDLRVLQAQTTRPNSHIFLIRGAFHNAFEDPSFSLRNLFKQLLLDSHRAHRIIGDYVIGFLDAYLKGDRRALIGANDPRYPEVRILDLSRLNTSQN